MQRQNLNGVGAFWATNKSKILTAISRISYSKGLQTSGKWLLVVFISKEKQLPLTAPSVGMMAKKTFDFSKIGNIASALDD